MDPKIMLCFQSIFTHKLIIDYNFIIFPLSLGVAASIYIMITTFADEAQITHYKVNKHSLGHGRTRGSVKKEA